ncbi:pyroglutamyl-peptidase I [Bacillus sp. HMF5848]|uniref:pyroglutamyl-peptidase I n=1 Tax=Bacillus sp. HMF5848 TaxID=2495421 RepID=UPI000F78A33F|nr:pyroglutamyl-peptidase I [Bacillus sp. HMF5848]RSK26757.1 pyroglutamyl-peptidase I [Bacillus sp. HMF5848]
MNTLLLTGFEPFLDHPLNPSAEIVKELDGMIIGDYIVKGCLLPVEFSQSANQMISLFDEVKPDVVISLGLAAGRNTITPERIAINCNDGVKDNSGFIPEDEAIIQEGPVGYFSTLPIRTFVNVLREYGYPAEISNSAGTYLCNNVMYQMLHYISVNQYNCLSGFVHIPASHDLAVISKRTMPSWSHADLVEACKVMIQSLAVEK